MSLAPPISTLADRFDAACALLLFALRLLAPKNPLMEVAIARASRIRAGFARFARQPARYAPGRAQPADGAGSPRTAPPLKQRTPPTGGRPMPRAFGWAVGDGLLDTLFRELFSRLVAHPEMAALAATAPERATRVLRPLCRMLGVTPPAGLFSTRARRSRRARTSAPAQAASGGPALEIDATVTAAPTTAGTQVAAASPSPAFETEVEVTAPSTKPATQAVAQTGTPNTSTQGISVPGIANPAPGSDVSTSHEAGTTGADTASAAVFRPEPPSAEQTLLREMEREAARRRPPAVTVPSKPPDWALAWHPARQFMTERMRYMRVVDVDDWPPEI